MDGGCHHPAASILGHRRSTSAPRPRRRNAHRWLCGDADAGAGAGEVELIIAHAGPPLPGSPIPAVRPSRRRRLAGDPW
jgi:hypothetical protein